MSGILTNVGLIATQLFSIAGTAISTVTSNPLLLIFFSIAIVGAGVGLYKRLIG